MANHLGTAVDISTSTEEEELEDVGKVMAQHMQRLKMVVAETETEMEKAKKKEEKLLKEMQKVEKEGEAYRSKLEGISGGVRSGAGQINALLNSK